MGRSRSVRRRKHKQRTRLDRRALRFYKANYALAKTAKLLNDTRFKDPNSFIASVGLILEHWRREANFWAAQLGGESEKMPPVWDKNVLLKRISFIRSLVFSENPVEDQKEKKLMIEELFELLRSAFWGKQPYCPKQLNSSKRYEMRL